MKKDDIEAEMPKEAMVGVTVGYQTFLVPMKIGFQLFEGLTRSGCYRLDSHYESSTKTSTDTLSKVEIQLMALTREDIAMRKLNTFALEQKQQEGGG